ncbi:MAG: hypothetical protein Q9227_007530 [Pyrenula ochraceoflavens]
MLAGSAWTRTPVRAREPTKDPFMPQYLQQDGYDLDDGPIPPEHQYPYEKGDENRKSSPTTNGTSSHGESDPLPVEEYFKRPSGDYDTRRDEAPAPSRRLTFESKEIADIWRRDNEHDAEIREKETFTAPSPHPYQMPPPPGFNYQAWPSFAPYRPAPAPDPRYGFGYPAELSNFAPEAQYNYQQHYHYPQEQRYYEPPDFRFPEPGQIQPHENGQQPRGATRRHRRNTSGFWKPTQILHR